MAKDGRLYVPLDVHFYEDAKILEVSPMAELLFVRALCAAKKMGGGRLSAKQVHRIDPEPSAGLPDELVGEGLWERGEDGYYSISAWDLWNGETAAEAGVRGNHVRHHVNKGRTAPDCPLCPTSSRGDGRGEPPPPVGANVGATSPPDSHTEQSEAKQKNRPTARRSASQDPDFDECWVVYPRKEARVDALKAYRARRKDGAPTAELLTATRNFAAAMRREGRRAQHVMLGQTFFGPGERWRDYLGAQAAPRREDNWLLPDLPENSHLERG